MSFKDNFKKLNKKYVWLWVVWLLMFGVIEWRAIMDKREGDTFTEILRAAMGTGGTREILNWVFRIGVGAFLIWAWPHFFTGAA